MCVVTLLLGGSFARARTNGLDDLRITHRSYGRLTSRLGQIADAQQVHGASAALAAAATRGIEVSGSRVQVDVLARPGRLADAEAAIRTEGGQVGATAVGTITALVPPDSLKSLALSTSVAEVRDPPLAVAETADEGLAMTNAPAVHAAGFDGTGVRVAVIDLGFQQLNAVFGNTLPSWLVPQNFNCPGFSPLVGGLNNWGPTPHGTAVTEVLHQMAPGATVFDICINSIVDLWNAEQWAASAGVKVINHSVGWYGVGRGDGNGDGAGDLTPDLVVRQAREDGILWVNAAGNDAQTHWSGAYHPDPSEPSLNDFAGGDVTNSVVIAQGVTACVFLRWDAWPVTTEDYDLGLFDPSSATPDDPVASSTDDQASQLLEPTESLCYTNTGPTRVFGIVISRYNAVENERLDLSVVGGDSALEYASPEGSVVEPASAPEALAVGAVCWRDGSLQPYSSRGPTIDGRTKPDLVAPDAVSSSVYGSGPTCSDGFTGTSAAAPEVAGAAALLSQQLGSSTADAGTTLKADLEAESLAHTHPINGLDDVDEGEGPLWISTVPSGTRIALSSNSIWGVNSDGSGAHLIAPAPACCSYSRPSWNPNGTKLAFGRGGQVPFGIETVNADGSNLTMITTTSNVPEGVSWSPDGTKLAFGYTSGGGIHVVNADGSGGISDISAGNDLEPAWSPDSTKIAFVRSTGGPYDLYVMNADGTGVTRLTTSGLGGTFPSIGSPAWSPDGTKIAYGTGNAIDVVSSNGTGSPVQVVAGGSQPAWSADGSKILYAASNGALRIVNADGTGDALVFSAYPSFAAFAPAWSSAAANSSAPPLDFYAPNESGTPSVGQYLDASTGVWGTTWPIRFSYEWERCDANPPSSCSSIAASGSAYQLTSADIGSYIRARLVGATPTADFGDAPSGVTSSPVVDARPYASTLPTISGVAQSGQTLTTSAATWQSSPTTLNRQWWRCLSDGSECNAIPGATGNAYTLTDNDVGWTIRVSEFRALASFGVGASYSNVVSSVQTAVVAPAA
ncbi:MAG TPA: S8 family serine peptidase, partial [Gaiellaceae bacterium]